MGYYKQAYRTVQVNATSRQAVCTGAVVGKCFLLIWAAVESISDRKVWSYVHSATECNNEMSA
jgi:hypothetical protein